MIVFLIVAIAIRLVTLAISLRDERQLKLQGAVEYGATTSKILALAHVVFYLSAAAEGLWKSAPLNTVSYTGFALYAFGMIMLFYVIHLLGRFWTVKLIVAPDHELVTHPLFRFVRHPNYFLNIIPELVGFALAFQAYHTLTFGLPLYLTVLFFRIRKEEQVMKQQFSGY